MVLSTKKERQIGTKKGGKEKEARKEGKKERSQEGVDAGTRMLQKLRLWEV